MTESAARAALRRFRAPGKLMLAGEYSVLGAGGEALALAVELGVEVDARPHEHWELRRAESSLIWQPGQPVPEELRFAHAAWDEARSAFGEPSPHVLTTRSFGDVASGANKAGVGGSASATVAVAAALMALGGRGLDRPGRERLIDVAVRAHLRAQAGRGSAYDVATSALGGLLRWQPRRGAVAARANALAWPSRLALIAGYSGRSAPTASFLSRVSRCVRSADLEADLQALAEPVRGLIVAFERGECARVLAGVRACQQALREWDQRRGLGLITPELEQLVQLAEQAGAACKISGAGGGDSVIALADHRELLDEVARRWLSAGFTPFSPRPNFEGVREIEDRAR